tara:strand:- start:1139 stop:1477 length:339 start_codon:yes stop_codon:yes gene_type:complete
MSSVECVLEDAPTKAHKMIAVANKVFDQDSPVVDMEFYAICKEFVYRSYLVTEAAEKAIIDDTRLSVVIDTLKSIQECLEISQPIDFESVFGDVYDYLEYEGVSCRPGIRRL